VFFNESGSVTVLGSSEKNKEGRFIWWSERLAYHGASNADKAHYQG
jgi:hypothetical protein